MIKIENRYNDNEGNPDQNGNLNTILSSENRYINQKLYPIVRIRGNINPNNLRIEKWVEMVIVYSEAYLDLFLEQKIYIFLLGWKYMKKL